MVVDPTDGMPWDFRKRTKRERARDIMREQKPYMLIGSPACKAFCTWMNLNRARAADTTAMDKALAEIAKLQVPVAELFTAVMVNDPDLVVRQNRHALLQAVREVVLEVADFAAFQIG